MNRKCIQCKLQLPPPLLEDRCCLQVTCYLYLLLWQLFQEEHEQPLPLLSGVEKSLILQTHMEGQVPTEADSSNSETRNIHWPGATRLHITIHSHCCLMHSTDVLQAAPYNVLYAISFACATLQVTSTSHKSHPHPLSLTLPHPPPTPLLYAPPTQP